MKNSRNRLLTREELPRLVRALEAESAAVLERVRMAYFSGGRWGEIDKLRWQDVDYETGFVTWRDTKTGETNESPISPDVRAILDALPQPVNRSQVVFPPLAPTCHRHAEFHDQGVKCVTCYQAFRRAWRAALATAKVTDYHFHDLRHQACTALANDGRQQADLKAFCRHSSVTMTARYTHLSDKRRLETAARLSDTPAGEVLGAVAPKWPTKPDLRAVGAAKPL